MKKKGGRASHLRKEVAHGYQSMCYMQGFLVIPICTHINGGRSHEVGEWLPVLTSTSLLHVCLHRSACLATQFSRVMASVGFFSSSLSTAYIDTESLLLLYCALMKSGFFFHGYWNLFLVIFLLSQALASKQWNSFMVNRDGGEGDSENEGTRWAVLVAGSNGFSNYRHQADVCHAYQILKTGGLKDENIVVFMYDDIVMHEFNPRPGVVINHPQGDDVYAGVPKDYTGGAVTSENLYAVLLGDASSVKGGTGKVVSSKLNDRIFVYYSDHGGPGVLGMPTTPFVYADDLIDVLKRKHASGNYKEMVIYIEACESGSIFEGMMPKDLNIYVMTASNAEESSWGTYCPGMDPPPPPEYATCLADLYSVSWMEDSETHNLKKETINQQYDAVKKRTSNSETYNAGSHVMEYGNKSIKAEKLYLYQGSHPVTSTIPEIKNNLMGVVNQRDADILFLSQMYIRSEHYPGRREQLLKQIKATMGLRAKLDNNMKLVEILLFRSLQNPHLLDTPRASGLPLVDDWKCLKTMVMVFETECGSLSQYGMKYMRVLANICNMGVSVSAMEEACAAACHGEQGSIYLTRF